MSEILELETRRNIYDLIAKNPGINLSSIAKILNISFQLVDYHLLYLQHHDLITVTKQKGFKRCYIRDTIGLQDKHLLSLLQQDIPLRIVLYLLKHPYARHKDMLAYFRMGSPHFSYHLRKLVKQHVIKQDQHNDSTGYILVDKKSIIEALIKYKPQLISDMVKDFWKDFQP